MDIGGELLLIAVSSLSLISSVPLLSSGSALAGRGTPEIPSKPSSGVLCDLSPFPASSSACGGEGNCLRALQTIFSFGVVLPAPT